MECLVFRVTNTDVVGKCYAREAAREIKDGFLSFMATRCARDTIGAYRAGRPELYPALRTAFTVSLACAAEELGPGKRVAVAGITVFGEGTNELEVEVIVGVDPETLRGYDTTAALKSIDRFWEYIHT